MYGHVQSGQNKEHSPDQIFANRETVLNLYYSRVPSPRISDVLPFIRETQVERRFFELIRAVRAFFANTFFC
jgi:hypothetical protein